MLKRKIKVDVLSPKSIDDAIKQIKNFQIVTMKDKINKFLSMLADEGISVAKSRTGVLDDLGNVQYYVYYEKKFSVNGNQYTCVLEIGDKMPYRSYWVTRKGLQSANVSPTYMYEFGSGQHAANALGVSGVGQGTFPGQKHAFNPSGWSWKGVDGRWHHSRGITPTMPLYNAWLEMKQSIERIAKKAFE